MATKKRAGQAKAGTRTKKTGGAKKTVVPKKTGTKVGAKTGTSKVGTKSAGNNPLVSKKKDAKVSSVAAKVKVKAQVEIEEVENEDEGGIPAEVRGTAEWSDMNKRMFIERIEVKKRIARLEERNNPAKRRELARAKREYETLTMKIVDANYGLLRKYVKLFTGSATREDAKDFEAAGRLGLMRAIDNYDPYRGSFAQWAFKPIQREVLRAVHSADHNNMNPGDFERRPEILRALKKLQGENEDLKPTEAQVAAEAGVTIEQVKRVLHAPRMDSLHTPVGDADGAVLSDLIEDKNSLIEDAVISSIGVETLTNYGLSALDAREYFVLSRRLGLDCEPEQRLSAIGDMLKLSREAVRQIEAKAIAKMSHPVLLRLLVRNGKN
jgi:RNA polymerase sigma factor (sigma-70 family)